MSKGPATQTQPSLGTLSHRFAKALFTHCKTKREFCDLYALEAYLEKLHYLLGEKEKNLTGLMWTYHKISEVQCVAMMCCCCYQYIISNPQV